MHTQPLFFPTPAPCPPCNSPRLMTKRDTFIEKDIMMNIVMNIQDWDSTLPMPTILKPRPLWTGKQVRSGRGAVMFWLGRWFALAGVF